MQRCALVGFVAVTSLLAACGGSEPIPLPSPSGAARPSLPLETGRTKVWPNSAEVEQGQPYAFVLSTHCGVDHQVDFDHSFWDATAQEGTFADPTDTGAMTLTGADTSSFESDGDGGGTIEFARVPGSKDVMPCE